jgi:serine phosphatase RsbU (regulator of sigma subunit)
MVPDFLETKPFVTLIYGEVLKDGRFRFLFAGHPPPMVFSQRYDRIVPLEDDCTKASAPLGIFPSRYHVDIEHFAPATMTKESYSINEINLGRGDILLLYSDGLIEHQNGSTNFCDGELEQVLRAAKAGTAKEIHDSIRSAMCTFAVMQDDLTLSVIKKI